jgi:hypothetical protein
MRRTAVLWLALAACGSSSSGEPERDGKKGSDAPRKLAGVYPENFRCDSVATTDALAEALAGPVRALDSPSSIPRGVPHPCAYEVERQPQPEYWTFDFDCRDGYKQRADALFEQYTRTSAELVEAYNGASDAAPDPTAAPPKKHDKKDYDAGIDAPQRAPEEAAVVQVGAKGLDHHGQGLLFIDDDAPCYVRVVGPDKEHRLALALLIAKNLTFANAPMTPRPFK